MSCSTSSPKRVAALAIRLSFGLTLLLVGIDHVLNQPGFATGMVASNLGSLEPLGQIWGYVLPILQIVGGACIATGMYLNLGVWSAGLALGSIPVGMTLKALLSESTLPDVMPMVNNTYIWLLLFVLVVKTSCCGSCSSEK